VSFLRNLFGGKGDSSAPQGDQVLAQQHFEKGAVYAQQQDWTRAVGSLSEAVRLNPKHAKAHLALCMSYGGMMDLDSARRHYDILKQLDSGLAEKLANSPAGMLMLRGGNVIRM
jgi:Tfp pilus assembly protein PilF